MGGRTWPTLWVIQFVRCHLMVTQLRYADKRIVNMYITSKGTTCN